MTTNKQAFPIPTAPLVDLTTGAVTPEWLRLFMTILNRTGGTSGTGATLVDTSSQAIIALLDQDLPDVVAPALADTSYMWMIDPPDPTALYAPSLVMPDQLLYMLTQDIQDVSFYVQPVAVPSTGNFYFPFIQAAPITVWTINHNLAQYPAVEVLDNNGAKVEGDVLHVSANQVSVSFTNPFSGAAYCNSGNSYFAFTQSVPATVWTITHNLGRYPSIEVLDSTGRQVEGDVLHISANQATVSFISAFSGVAYCNSGNTYFAFTQSTPLAVWTITHNLGRYPDVEVLDNTGAQIEADVLHVSAMQVTVSFTNPFSGVAYCN